MIYLNSPSKAVLGIFSTEHLGENFGIENSGSKNPIYQFKKIKMQKIRNDISRGLNNFFIR